MSGFELFPRVHWRSVQVFVDVIDAEVILAGTDLPATDLTSAYLLAQGINADVQHRRNF